MSTDWVRVEGVTWQTSKRDQLIALAAALALLVAVVASVAPASAGKPGGSSWTPPSGMFGSEVAWRTGVEPMWDLGYTGSGIDVAVIDTGVNAVQGLDGRDKIIDGPDFSFDSDDANLRHRDLYGHGTAMASLVAGAAGKNADLVGANNMAYGMAPNARIVNVKVGDGVGAVDVSQVIAAIDWVVQHRNANGMNVRVMLLAFDTDSTQGYLLDPLAYAVENAWHHGITVVVSAGNDGKSAQTLGNPAIDPYVIAVGGVEPAKGNSWKVPGWASSGDGIRNPDLATPAPRSWPPPCRAPIWSTPTRMRCSTPPTGRSSEATAPPKPPPSPPVPQRLFSRPDRASPPTRSRPLSPGAPTTSASPPSSPERASSTSTPLSTPTSSAPPRPRPGHGPRHPRSHPRQLPRRSDR